ARADPREVRHVENRVRLHTTANATYPPQGGIANGAVMRADNAERFERLLVALERELIEATDQEILEAAGDLGMNPAMKGSAAFFGVTMALHSALQPTDPMESSYAASVRRRLKDDPPH